MSLIARARAPKADEARSGLPSMSWADWVATYAGVGYSSGSVDLALKNAASKACIRVLASSMARTPFDVSRSGQPVVSPLLERPSGVVQPDVWRFQVAFSLVTDGNAFGRIVRSGRDGWPEQVETIAPATVGGREVVEGVPQVRVNGGNPERLWPFGPIWHVPGLMVPAGTPFALSPLTDAAKTVGTSLCVEDFAHQFFTDGGHPTTAYIPAADPGPEGAARIKAAIQRATQGNREPLVIGGLDIKQLQSDPNETQFIDLARFEVEQACRHWGVPPSMVYAAVSGQNVTYSNVTQADLHYLKHSLDDYLVRLENAFTAVHPRPQVVKANRNAILRADVAARYAAYEVGLRNGFITLSEVRALEDLPPLGDAPDGVSARELAEMIQKIYLGVGVVLSAEEAREILNREGGGLTGPAPSPEGTNG